MRLRFIACLCIMPLLVGALVIGGAHWATGDDDGRSALTSALDSLPAGTTVAGFSDWAKIRDHLGVDSLTSSSDRDDLVNGAAARDLSTRSVIGRSVEEMRDAYGWSVADVDWEVYGQAPTGAAMVVKLDDDVSPTMIEKRLDSLGYKQDGDAWTVGTSLPASISTDLAETFTAVVVLPDQRMVVAADRPAYASKVLEVIRRHDRSLLSVPAASAAAQALLGADTVLLEQGSHVCQATSFDDEDAGVIAQAKAASKRAGGLDDVAYAGRALSDVSPSKQTLRFALGFGSAASARAQLSVRTVLTKGAFIGRPGRIEDSLLLSDASVDNSMVSLTFDHDPKSALYMAGTGPLLFAGCRP